MLSADLSSSIYETIQDGKTSDKTWALSYWLAFMANSTFYVFLEDLQGGIWCWSFVGIGIALLEVQRKGYPLPIINKNPPGSPTYCGFS